MRPILAVAINAALALMLYIGMAGAQEERGGMMMRRMPMMDWPGMVVL